MKNRVENSANFTNNEAKPTAKSPEMKRLIDKKVQEMFPT